MRRFEPCSWQHYFLCFSKVFFFFFAFLFFFFFFYQVAPSIFLHQFLCTLPVYRHTLFSSELDSLLKFTHRRLVTTLYALFTTLKALIGIDLNDVDHQKK
ncbi:uncharacterized protein F4822DRAFT_276223 [Hypoxylon trugodes]|uniref:uncharacterized protein n=1 Tax=Hypoxylon trugodes TaxID=326681 RepID=UPI0021989B99|nr:uncharacterized protein F4822DRAFT_276223 [Hypoxylon trugodes]KAI1387187.1 hypothetical protein F4822DRAFT_276223 [Hypoxylon trugodes]